MTTEPSLGQRLKERLRQQEIAEVFSREGIQGLKNRGLFGQTFGAPVPLGKGLKRAAKGLPAIVGGAFTEEGTRAFGNIVLGEGRKPSIRIPEPARRGVDIAVRSIIAPSTAATQLLPGKKAPLLAPKQLGVRGAVEAAAPIPLGGPIAAVSGRVAAIGARAAAPGVKAAARAVGPAAGRLAREEGGFARILGGAKAIPEETPLERSKRRLSMSRTQLEAEDRLARLEAEIKRFEGLAATAKSEKARDNFVTHLQTAKGQRAMAMEDARIANLAPAAGQVAPSPAPAAPSPATKQVAGGAPPVPPKPPVAQATPPPEDFAKNIRLSKFPEELRPELKNWAEANPEQVQAARRGVRPDAQVLQDAQRLVEEMGGDFAKTQRRWKPGQAWNIEEITAIRGLLRQRTKAVLEAAQAARASNTVQNHTGVLLAMQEQARVQEIVHGVTAESGRALRAFRQEAAEALASDDVARMEMLLKRISSLIGADRSKLDEVVAALAQLDINNPVVINNFIRNLQKPKLWDYITELFINGILSGPKTHIINNLTNVGNTLISSGERTVTAGVEQILAPLQRRKIERFFSEAPADLIGAISGIEEGTRGALFTLRNGMTPGAASKYEFRRAAFKGNLGRIIRAPGTALEAADTFSYAMNYRAALSALAVRAARKEGLKGQALVGRIAELKQNPIATLIAEAQKAAEYRLFRQETGKFVSSLLAFREQHPALRFVIPFVRTPINIFKFGLERSPLGAFNPALWRNLAAKNPEASEQIARVFIGSTLAAFIAWQFSNGKITGRAPDNAAERDRFYREGKLSYAVRVGDKWIQYQRLEPFNQIFGLVAAAVDAINAKDKTAKEKVEDAVLTISQNLLSQTYMRGLSDVMNAVTAPERYGTSFLGRLASGLVPFSAALRTTAQIVDPTIRRPRTIPESVEVGLPGLSRQVPPALTAFGEEAQRQGLAVSPIAFSPAQQSDVDRTLEEVGLEISFVGNTISGKELTREEQQEYQRLAGQLTYSALIPLVTSAGYRSLPLSLKEDILTKARDNARERARITMRLRIALKPKIGKEVMAGG